MRKLIIIPFLLICSLLFCQSNYYVATDGDDDAVGDITHPWLTWSKAFTTADAGDTVFFRGGTYNTTATTGGGIIFNPSISVGNYGTYASPIVFMAYPGEVPIMDCSNVLSTSTAYVYGFFFSYVTYTKFKGLILRNVQQVDATDVVRAFFLYKCGTVDIENCKVYNVGGIGFQSEESDTLTYLNCDAYNCIDSISAYLPGNYGSGFSAPNTTKPNALYKYIKCRAWNCGDQGFVSTGQGLTYFFG